MNYPKYLYRREDSNRFTLINSKLGIYTMDKCTMKPKYTYQYDFLLPRYFVDSLDKCDIQDFSNRNDGYGNGDFDE